MSRLRIKRQSQLVKAPAGAMEIEINIRGFPINLMGTLYVVQSKEKDVEQCWQGYPIKTFTVKRGTEGNVVYSRTLFLIPNVVYQLAMFTNYGSTQTSLVPHLGSTIEIAISAT